MPAAVPTLAGSRNGAGKILPAGPISGDPPIERNFDNPARMAALFDESKIKRATDGQFGSGGGGSGGGGSKAWSGGDLTDSVRKQSGGGKIVVTGKELGAGHSDEDVRHLAESYAKQHLQGKSFKNAAVPKPVAISRRSINKVINNSANVARAKIIPAIPMIIEAGKPTGPMSPSTKPGSHYDEYQRFEAEIEFEGKPHQVKFLIGKDDNGHWYYNHDLTEVHEKK